jgi:2-iminobutanoate/2-iminopropanoate deaminase
MSRKQVIISERAPAAIGPYSVANRFDNLIFSAGQLGLDPDTMELVPGGIVAETRQALINLQFVLESAGTSLNAVVKTTVFLRDINDFGLMNGVYAEFFLENFPARSAVQVAALPRGGAVEIEAVAIIE